MPRRCLVLAALLLATSPACAARSDTQPTDVVAKEPTVTQIQFIIGGQALTATLDDTLAGRDFASLLPLELTLTDAGDNPVSRRVLAPDDWLPADARSEAFAGRKLIDLSIPFEATGIAPTGYRIYAFYP